jgi:hypothetical protein
MLTGMDIARGYYEAYGRKMIDAEYGEYAARIATGLVGEGSECYGFDDELSQDHDFGAAFCMWLGDEDYEVFGEGLNAAYEKLPPAFRGFTKRPVASGGVRRVGAIRLSDFFTIRIGAPRPPEDTKDWLDLKETALATVTNGEVFRDDLGAFSSIRDTFLEFYPEDVRLKKLAARIGLMAQAGQYNYRRCLKREERVAAMLALGEFIEASMSAVYLLNKVYMPFYKWAHRGLSGLPKLSDLHSMLSAIESSATSEDVSIENTIEEICAIIIREMKIQRLTDANSNFLFDHCAHVMARIEDPVIRSMDVFAG